MADGGWRRSLAANAVAGGDRVCVWKVSPPAYVDLCGRDPHSSTCPSRESAAVLACAGGAAARRLRVEPPPRDAYVHTLDVRPSRPRLRPMPAEPAAPGVVNVYSADAAGDLSPVVRGDPALVYVPNSLSNTVDVISQRTLKIVAEFPVGALPQHVTPSYDLRTLYVDNDLGNSLTPIDPRTGQSRAPDPGRGSVQPVLHPRRPVRDRRGGAAAAARLPRPEHDAPGPFAAGARVPRRRSHGLLRGRAVRVRELRVRRPDDRDRPRARSR